MSADEAQRHDARVVGELVASLVDDCGLASGLLQSVTSLRAELETGPPPFATMDDAAAAAPHNTWRAAAETAGAAQALCLALRQRASDAQRAQLAVARGVERESAAKAQLAQADRSHRLRADELEKLRVRLEEAAPARVEGLRNELLGCKRELSEHRELVAELQGALRRSKGGRASTAKRSC